LVAPSSGPVNKLKNHLTIKLKEKNKIKKTKIKTGNQKSKFKKEIKNQE
jgi:hypothetical protein